ncbi:MAG: hypothetical protein ACI9FN_000146 [Saprospiraceae bacterium]|jgi:hypothetical protein
MAENTKSAAGKNWLYFGIALIITLFMLFFVNQWFWVGLPFTLTFLVVAMDKI